MASVDLLRKDIMVIVKSHELQLQTKVEGKALEDTQEKFSVQLDKFVTSTYKNFMNKSETKKTFKMFEK